MYEIKDFKKCNSFILRNPYLLYIGLQKYL